MENEQFGLEDDPYNSERAVLSIPEMYIKQEHSEVQINEYLTLSTIETMTETVQDYNVVSEEVITSTENISMEIENPQILNAFNKIPIELAIPMNSDTVKVERSHFIKYLVRDGKHIKVWECGICAKEFGHQYTLMRHLPTHTDERKFRCNTCGKAFRQMSTLSQHRAIHSADRPYICEICRKTFNRVSTLISHRKTHTGLKPHRCHLCNKAFHQKGNLRNHVFTHTNERPYKCDVCEKGFNQMSNLMCHKLKAHHRSDKPRHPCKICGLEFPKRMALRNHEQYQHGVTTDRIQMLQQLPLLEHRPPRALQGCSTIVSASQAARVRCANGVLVEAINTEAMRMAIRNGQTPFALLRPTNGIPVLVRVLPAGDKQANRFSTKRFAQMLVPATAEDLRRHGQITITASSADQQISHPSLEDGSGDATISKINPNSGSIVQIKIPVVATVVQRCTSDGNLCMAVQSPGPKNDPNNGFVIATERQHFIENGIDSGDETFMNRDPSLAITQEIEYVDEAGNVIPEDEYQPKSEVMAFIPDEFVFTPESYDDKEDGEIDTNLDDSSLNVDRAIEALDKMVDPKVEENEIETEMSLSDNVQADSITIYSEATSILYGSQLML